MAIEKKIKLLTILALLLLFNISAFGQEMTKQKFSNAEYVFELIKQNPVDEVKIYLSRTKTVDYKKEWLEDISVNGNFIIFKIRDRMFIWNLEDVLLIEVYTNIIKIRLKDNIGTQT